MPTDIIWSETWKPDLDLEGGARRMETAIFKRLIDVLGAGLGLLILSPFLFIVGIMIWVESPGPVIFRQHRTGHGGKPFVIYKFRSMTTLDDGPVVVQAKRCDERTTRLGVWLRRTSVDELPNLINVLKGEMSLVGPRPHAVAHDRHWSALLPSYNARFMAKPGLTGLAQVNGYRGEIASIESMIGRVNYDVEYIRTWTLRQDLKILARTFMIGPFDPTAY